MSVLIKQALSAETEKRCGQCKEVKPVSQFYTCKNNGFQGRCRTCQLARKKPSVKNNPEHREVLRRENLRRHGLTLEEFNQLLADQGNGCAICGDLPKTTKTLHVDHDHRCCPTIRGCKKCIRGILCSRCNVGLGYFRDNTALLAIAINYLNKE